MFRATQVAIAHGMICLNAGTGLASLRQPSSELLADALLARNREVDDV